MARAKPNIVIILADDMGYGDCGCYGSADISTPRLDALAREGLRFTDFHSNGAVCSPTRAALLTGRYQQRCGIEGVLTAAGHRHVGLPATETTFAQVLRTAGYRTALFGKWHLGYDTDHSPLQRGFDEFRGFVSGNVDYRSHIDQTGREDWWADRDLAPEDGYTTDLVTEHGLRFIKENRDRSFCLYLAHECPHYPYQGPSDEAYRRPGNPGPSRGPREDKEQAYKEMMESMDAGIGRVVDTIDSLGLGPDTLVFFFSDNGPDGPGSAGGLRGRKGSVWEGGHRIPAIARWPGMVPDGTETAVPCMGMDLFATMVSAAEAQAPSGLHLDGVDLMPLLGGAAIEDRPLFWRHKAQRAVREGKWKLVVGSPGESEEALFALDTDPTESTNLAGDHPDVTRELRERLDRWENDVSTTERLS